MIVLDIGRRKERLKTIKFLKTNDLFSPLLFYLYFCTYFYISSYKIDDDLYTFLFEPKKNRGGTNIRDGGTQ